MLCKKLFAGLVVLIAIVVGAAAVTSATTGNLLVSLSMLSHFAVPAFFVVTFGAVLKYLFSCSSSRVCPCCAPGSKGNCNTVIK